jgi:hypothetical protein
MSNYRNLKIAYGNIDALMRAMDEKMGQVAARLGDTNFYCDPEFFMLSEAMGEIGEARDEYRYTDEVDACWDGYKYRLTEKVANEVITVALAPAEYSLVSSFLA